MKSTLTDIMKALPDFDDLNRSADEIADLMYEKMITDNKIKAKEANVFKITSTDQAFFIGGKPAPVSYVENTYKFGGLGGEILQDRQRLAELVSALERAKMKLSLYKDMLDIWRTLSANERSSAL